MASMNVSTSPGRPGFSPLEKARREAARCLKERDAIREEFLDLLNLTEEDMKPLSARGEEILSIANSRRKICQQIDDVDGQIREGSKQDIDAKVLKELKKERTRLYDRLNTYPELGYTRKEWEQADPSLKEKDIGRPKLRIEQRLNRAMAAYVDKEQEVRKIEGKHGVAPADLESYIKKVEHPEVGRPRLDLLAKMDRRILKIDEDIKDIESGRAQQEQDEAIQKRMARLGINDPSKLPGRPLANLAEKLARLKREKSELCHKIAQAEKRLDDITRAEREVSKYKLALKQAKRELRNAPEKGQPKLEQRISTLNARLASAQADLARIRNLKNTIKVQKQETAYPQNRLEKGRATPKTTNAPGEAMSSKASPGRLREESPSKNPQGLSSEPAVAKTGKPATLTPAVAQAEKTAAHEQAREESREYHRARLESEREEFSIVLDEMLAQAGISTYKGDEQPQRKSISLLDKLAKIRVSNG